jgi:hypothetical protein
VAYQTQFNGYVAYKAQSALGTQATGGSALMLRTAGGQGGRLTKAAIESQEVRRDGMSSRGRHGSQKTAGAYSGELSLGVADTVMEAVFRGTYEAELAITEATASLTSITTTTSTIVAAAGSWITAGLRVGDVIALTNHATAANNSKNLRITGLTASTITVAGTPLTLNAVADTAFTVTRTGRKLVNPTSGLTNRYFTVEEHELDIDGSEIFTDCMWGSLKFSMQPNGIIMLDTAWTGTGQFETKTGGSAPHFTSPTETTAVPMACVDATIRLGSSDLVDLTGFELTLDISPAAVDTIASDYSPDVFPGTMTIGGSITALRADLSHVASFLAETELSLHVLAVENESEPKSFVSIYVPNFTLGSVDKSALNKAGGPRTQTIAIPPSLVGIKPTTSGHDSTMAKIQISNNS